MRETWNGLIRRLRRAWFHLRHPGLAVLADQMVNTGVLHDSTIIPPNAGSEPIIKWFEERLAYADTSQMQLCRVTLVPAGVEIYQRGWTKQAVDLV